MGRGIRTYDPRHRHGEVVGWVVGFEPTTPATAMAVAELWAEWGAKKWFDLVKWQKTAIKYRPLGA